MLHRSTNEAVIFFISSFIIDIDHYIFYSVQNRSYSLNVFMVTRDYKKWSYYGPRIMILHNYEFILLCFFIAYLYGGVFWYIAAGCLFHLSCDQIDTWVKFKIIRVRTLTYDVIRYNQYRKAKKQHLEKEYMIKMRDSWINHLKQKFSDEKFNQYVKKCGITSLYPEIPVKKSTNNYWKSIL